MRRLLILFLIFNGLIHLQAQEQKSVLFIGNSYTFMYEMPVIFKKIAAAKGHAVHVDSVVQGGKNLEYHAGQKITYEKINSRKWDFIVIQAHSNELAQPESKIDKNTLPFAQQIVDSIRASNPCTQLVFYLTWAYKNGNQNWKPIASFDSMQYRITNQYLRFADLMDGRISPVGEVWKVLKDNYSGINLYDPDSRHPNLAGSYLIACTFFASIYGESPLRNKIPIEIPKETRQIIEMNTSQLVLNNLNKWRFIPENPSLKNGFDLMIQGQEVRVFNRVEQADFISWDFGDGFKIVDQSPTHTYLKSGKYEIEQIVHTNCQEYRLKRSIELK